MIKTITSLLLVVLIFFIGFAAFTYYDNYKLQPSTKSTEDNLGTPVDAQDVYLFEPGSDIKLDDKLLEIATSQVDEKVLHKIDNSMTYEKKQEIAYELSETCTLSVLPDNVTYIISRLHAYAEKYGVQFDPEYEEKKYSSMGPEMYIEDLQARYNIPKDEVIDLLCASATSVVKNEVIQEKHAASLFLADKDIELPEVSAFFSSVCNMQVSDDIAYSALQEIVKTAPDIDLSRINFNEEDPKKLWSSISEALGVTPEYLRSELCSKLQT